MTYDALCAAVWGADYAGYENSLGVHIRHLREKIEAEPSRPRWLLTARGHRLQTGRGGKPMKTFARLIRRYVFAAVGLGLLLPALCIGLLVWLGWQTGQYMPQWAYSSGAIADSMVSTADGLTFGAEHTPQEWMDGYAWAMALDDDGNVFWHYNLPDLLNRRMRRPTSRGLPTGIWPIIRSSAGRKITACSSSPCLRAVCGNTIFTARPRSSPT